MSKRLAKSSKEDSAQNLERILEHVGLNFERGLQHRIHDIAVKAFYSQTSLVLSSLQQSGLQGSPPEDSAPSASFRAFLATVLCIELSFADKLR